MPLVWSLALVHGRILRLALLLARCLRSGGRIMPHRPMAGHIGFNVRDPTLAHTNAPKAESPELVRAGAFPFRGSCGAQAPHNPKKLV
jgi:hypothetical protein